RSFKALLFGMSEDCLPTFFADGRRYLVFLKPGDWPTQEPYFDVGPSEVIAVVDLSQSQAEEAALKVQSTRIEHRHGFDFTPANWEQFRNFTMAADPVACKQFQDFIESVVARPGASLARVRSYLGQPDDWCANHRGFLYT